MYKQIKKNYGLSVLQSPLLVNQNGLPRYWSTVWASLSLHGLAESTQAKKLRSIDDLYDHADLLNGPGTLDTALATLNEKAIGEILESWFITIVNKPRPSSSDNFRWQSALEFVSSIINWLAKNQDPNEKLRQIESRIHRLSLLYKQLHIPAAPPKQIIRSLPVNVVQALNDLLLPESPTNPFKRIHTRWLIFTIFQLLLHLGLRRGEALLLSVDAIKSSYDKRANSVRYWINIEKNRYSTEAVDRRSTKPNIKTIHSIRQLPISEKLAAAVQTYAENYRGRPNHPFLLNSQINQPLSVESVTKIFATISAALPKTIIKELKDRTGKTSVTPHDLRHTCAVIRLNQLLGRGDSMDEAVQKLRTFFGWSKESEMPIKYARAVFEDRLASVWNDIFDDRITILRSIPAGN